MDKKETPPRPLVWNAAANPSIRCVTVTVHREREEEAREQPGWHGRGFAVGEFVTVVGSLFPWHRLVPVTSGHVKHRMNFHCYWMALRPFYREVSRHSVITSCRFANNDITQSPHWGYDLLQITKCYFMEISFHTTVDWRGESSRDAGIAEPGALAISGPGTAPGSPAP